MKRQFLSVITAVVCLSSVFGLMMAQEQPAAPTQAKQMMKGKAMKKDMMKKGAGEQSEEKSMMAQHEEVTRLVTQVAADLALLQNEADAAIVKSKLAVDQAALEKVRDQMQQHQAKMKDMMREMMSGMAKSDTAAAPKDGTQPAPPPVDHSQHH